MRLLFSSDWQIELENIPICQKVIAEILALKKKLGFQLLVHCGDVKQVYNPVDVRVTNFALRAIDQLREGGLKVVICLGNHDRTGMYVDKQNWFPVLRKAGAEAYDDPARILLADGWSLRVLPFRASETLLRREAYDLARIGRGEKTILVFHSDVKRAQYNVHAKSDSKLSIEDLYCERYRICIGGHIHLQHRVGKNVWYVGSPFATDWGEANQRKGYLLFDTKTEKLQQIRSKIPGWYDPAWPGFEESAPETWEGARIRIKVPCADAKHIGGALRLAKEKAEKKYVGAEILVIPEIMERELSSDGIKAEYPDQKKLAIYLKRTLPGELQPHKKRVLGYLVEQVKQAGGLVREGGELRFRKYSAENFLSFKKLDWELTPGLCVVAGRNKDWNRSNGAGKSGSLAVIAVALFGTTFKGQKHDHWIRRGTKKNEKSFVGVWLEDGQGRKVFVKRSRQPRKLRLFINGDPVESGNRPEATQRLIEQSVGYTWETLSNAIYVDQGRTHLMLTGTESERKTFLNRLQNNERFERAGKLVKEEKTSLEGSLASVQETLQRLYSEKENLQFLFLQAQKTLGVGANPEKSYRASATVLQRAEEELKQWEIKAEKRRTEIEQQLEEQRAGHKNWEIEKISYHNQLVQLRDSLDDFSSLKGICPVCRQEITGDHVKRERQKLIKSIEQLEEKLKDLKKKEPSVDQDLPSELVRWSRNRFLEAKVAAAREDKRETKIHLEHFEKQKTLLFQLKVKRERILEQMQVQKQKEIKLRTWLGVLLYAEQVFSRGGLPAFLNQQLVPQLNVEADYYAELFAQKEIQVHFVVDEEGSLDAQVINAHGGENIQDQSAGELKMASLITSFAVRSVAPKTNLLILDEPGDGLDPVSARQFARGLREVTKKFSCILCVTHNGEILSELEDSRRVLIVKENGISRMTDDDR